VDTVADDLTRPIRVSENGRFLVEPDGNPFFWLADTGWGIFARLDRDEADVYLQDRAAKGFNVIQAVAIGGPFDSLEVPNRYGELALIDGDPAHPNPRYFEHIDWVVARAADYGLRMAMLPVWGARLIGGIGASESIFDRATAEQYGRWIGARYRNQGFIWVLGGDTNPLWPKHLNAMAVFQGDEAAKSDLTIIDFRPIYDAMATGIIEGDGDDAVLTFHPNPVSYSGTARPRTSLYLHDRDWLTINMLQSSHYRSEATDIFPGLRSDFTLLGPFNYDAVRQEYESTPTRPVIDGEPRYEGLPVDIKHDPVKGWWTAYDARNAAYHAVFAGAAGHTFGNNSVHQSHDPARYPQVESFYPGLKHWREELDSAGATQMRHVKALMLSRPYFTRIPDQSFLVGDAGQGEEHIAAIRDADGRYAMVYSPKGKSFRLELSKITGPRALAWWFDPRSGAATRMGSSFATSRKKVFTPPSAGPESDWVLVLDSEGTNFGPPGEVR
jgi:hypothetical protein